MIRIQKGFFSLSNSSKSNKKLNKKVYIQNKPQVF